MAGYDYSHYPIAIPDGPPPPRPKSYRIWSVPIGDPTIGRVLSPNVVKVWTHYDRERSRSIFCGGEGGACLMNHDEHKPRWSGYLLVELRSHIMQPVILHVTPHAVESCPDLLDQSQPLTNARISGRRDGRTRRARVVVQLERGFFALAKAPREFDLLAHLVALFSADDNEERRARKRGNP